MAEGTGLENRHTGEPGIVSSNLTLSVIVMASEVSASEPTRDLHLSRYNWRERKRRGICINDCVMARHLFAAPFFWHLLSELPSGPKGRVTIL